MKRIFAPLLSSRTWRETAHLLADLPVGIALFTWAITMLALGAGLAITVIGIPLLALTVVSGRWIGVMERWRAATFLDVDTPAPLPLQTPTGLWPRLRQGLGDRAGWRGLLYGLVMLPWSIITFTFTVTMWSVALGLTTLPLYDWALPDGGFEWGSFRLTGFGLIGAYIGIFAVGLSLLAITPLSIHAMAEGDRRLVRLLLSRGPNEVLEERVTQLRESRDASVESAAGELRRIERDLHDGAQQRLVSLAMNLGIAKDRLRRAMTHGPRSWSAAPTTTRNTRSPNCVTSCAASIQQCSPTEGSTLRCRRSQQGAPYPSRSKAICVDDCRPRSSRPHTSSLRRRSRTSPSTVALRTPSCGCATVPSGENKEWWSRWTTTGMAVPQSRWEAVFGA